MRIYITCELDNTSGIGYIDGLDPYDNIERAINRAKVIIGDETYNWDIEKRNDYINKFEADANKYLRAGLNFVDQLGLVMIVVKDM